MEPIENILSDLYAIDSSFKKHEGELRQLIRRLQLSKPDFSIDDTFVRRLRSDLLYGGQVQPASSLMKSYLKQLFNNLIRSSVFGTAVAVVLLVPLAYGARIYTENQSLAGVQVENEVVSLGQRQQIVYTSQSAFGPIVATKQASQEESAVASSIAATTTPLTDAIAAAETTNAEITNTAQTGTSSLVYAGDLITLNQTTGAVLELDTSDQSRSEIINSIQSLGFDLTNINSVIASSTSETINLSESKPFGYSLTIDPDSASVAITEQTSLWPDNASLPNIKTLTSDISTIGTATAFLKTHNIDMSHYGTAQVVSENATSSIATVLLPLLINNQNVYNPDGSVYGITVTVDQIQNRVTAVTGISSQKYDASDYPLQTDFGGLLSAIGATTTQITSAIAADASSTIATTSISTLSTPIQGLIHYTNDEDSFFVPGLIFPLTVVSADGTTTPTAPLVVPLLETTSN
jgi:hypothetical protein